MHEVAVYGAILITAGVLGTVLTTREFLARRGPLLRTALSWRTRLAAVCVGFVMVLVSGVFTSPNVESLVGVLRGRGAVSLPPAAPAPGRGLVDGFTPGPQQAEPPAGGGAFTAVDVAVPSPNAFVGEWRGRDLTVNGGLPAFSDAALVITPEVGGLGAVANIASGPDLVQERFSVMVSGSEVTLMGEHARYLRPPADPNARYSNDYLRLTLSADGQYLFGDFSDGNGTSGKARFVRVARAAAAAPAR